MFICMEIKENESENSNFLGLVRDIIGTISPYIPLGYDNRPHVYVHKNFLFFTFVRASSQKEKIIYGENYTIFYDGYFTNECVNISYEDINQRGGVNSYIILKSNELIVDTSSAGLFSVFYSNKDRIILSSRPLFVELIRGMRIGDKNTISVEMNNDEKSLISRLAFGSWLTGNTGFKNIYRLLPDERMRISLSGNQISFEKKILLQSNDFLCNDLEMGIADLTASLLSAVKSEDVTVKRNILLSGGKDSRTIISALDAAKITFSARINGNPQNEEVIIAKKVFDTCKTAVDFTSQSQRAYYDSVYGGMESVLRTEGQVSHVAHQIYFDNVKFYDGVVFHGHGHLLRGGVGGWEKKPSIDFHEKKLFSSFISGWVNNELVFPCTSFLKSFYRNFLFSDTLAFYSHLHFRVGAYQTPGIIEMSGLNEYRFPLCDEQVVSSARKISIDLLQNEKAVFGAIKSLSPDLSNLPVYGEMWAFEKYAEDPFFPGRSKRMSNIDKNYFQSKKSGLELIGDKRQDKREVIAAKFIIDSGYFDSIKHLLTPRMRNVILSYAKNHRLPEEELARPLPVQKSAMRKTFEIFGLAISERTRWLREIRPSTSTYLCLRYIF